MLFSEKDLQLLAHHGDGEMGKRVKATFTILEAIQELDMKEIHVGKTTLADFLRGSQSKRILQNRLDSLKWYKSLQEYTIKEILAMTSYLLQEGYLTVIDADSTFPRPLIYVTDQGEKLLEEKRKIKQI